MTSTLTREPPRFRTRRAPGEDGLLADLAERALRGDLPEEVRGRVRALASRNSEQTMPLIFDALVKLRMAGVAHEEIARRFDVHVRTIYRWWGKAKPWLKEQYTRLDPAATYAEEMRLFDLQRERLVDLLMRTDDALATARLSAALDRLSEVRRRWMDAHRYFDAISLSDIAVSEEDSAEAKAAKVRKILVDAFDDVGPWDLDEQSEPEVAERRPDEWPADDGGDDPGTGGDGSRG